MSKKRKQLELLLEQQRAHLESCQAAVKAAHAAIWSTQGELRQLDEEKQRATRLAPAMVEVLRALNQEGAYLLTGDKRSGIMYTRLCTPKGETVTKQDVPRQVFIGMIRRTVITRIERGGWLKPDRYVITDFGRARLAASNTESTNAK